MSQLTQTEMIETDLQALIYNIHYLMTILGSMQKYTPMESYELMTRALAIKKEIMELREEYEKIEMEHNDETHGH